MAQTSQNRCSADAASSVGPSLGQTLRTFAALGVRRQLLCVEAVALVAFATGITRLLPFRWIRRLYGSPRCTPEATTRPETRTDPRDSRIEDVSWALAAVRRRTAGDGGCLARAIAGRIMLRRRGLAPTLVIGTRRDAAGALEFHAWLLEHGRPVTGVHVARQFTALAVFESDS